MHRAVSPPPEPTSKTVNSRRPGGTSRAKPFKVEAYPPKDLFTKASSPKVSANSAGSRPGSSISSRAAQREPKSSGPVALMGGKGRRLPW